MSDPAAALAAQYEAYPYPARDPREEARRLVEGSPSHLMELRQFLWDGGPPPAAPLRVLFAGGGTGDATVMLTQQLADAGLDAELTYLDLSEAAAETCRARLAARGLEARVAFVQGSLTDLEALGLGHFDYIDCCGVLHHLPEPATGLAALAGALAPGGGIGLMVYAHQGRSGVYPLQRALAGLGAGRPLGERLAQARRVLRDLPETNLFRRNPFLGDHLESDAGLVDLLLNPIDRAYGVAELAELASDAGLAPIAWIEPLRYDPALYLRDPGLLKAAAALEPSARAQLAEDLAGNLRKHLVYLARRDEEAGRVARPDGPSRVPWLRETPGPALAKAVARDLTLKGELDGLKLKLPLPRLAPAILARIDGRRSLGEIHEALKEERPALTWESFLQEARALDASLGGLNRLYWLKGA